MAPLLFARALVCSLVVGRGMMADPNLRQVSEPAEPCPRCDMIFSMLETDSSGERVQHIEMVERGEPKSGTTFMYHWAHGALIGTCNFLNEWFGGTSCQLRTGKYRGLFHTPEEVSIVFDPRMGGDDAKCSCDGVNRVKLSVTDEKKHTLPVGHTCPWQHPPGLATHEVGCLSADGGALKSYFDIWLCMKEAACTVNDPRHQFVIMRDPRAEAVSTFFHHEKFPRSKRPSAVGGQIFTLDEFTLAMAPVLCQWVALRHLLFSAMLDRTSAIFWYDEALLDPHKWHYEWLAAVGVHLPEPVVKEMADAALREDFDFRTEGKNDHPGVVEGHLEEMHSPTWQEMLRTETLVELDVIARQWLPPVILVKLDVPEH